MPSHPVSNPSRPELSEDKYRAYEPNFVEFLEVYPAPYALRPVRGALTSLVVRLREAANAVIYNSHKFKAPLLINLDSFREAWAKVQLSIVDDEVVIGPPGASREIARAKAAERVTAKPVFSISNPTLEELNALASAFRRGGCSEPFLFTGEVPPFTPPFGVAFESTPDGWVML